MPRLLNNSVVKWVAGLAGSLLASAVCAGAGVAFHDHNQVVANSTKIESDHETLIHIRDRVDTIADFLGAHK